MALGPMSLIAYAPIALDQGATGSCEGHSHAVAIYTAMFARGVVPAYLPSPADMYRLARCIERDGAAAPLRDTGTESAYICAALNVWGTRPMGPPVQDPCDANPRNSDASILTICDEPSFADLEVDRHGIIVGQYACDGGMLTDRNAAVQTSLAKNAPVTIGGFVDSAYMRWEPTDGVYQRASEYDPHGGGHSQVILAWRVNAGGRPEYQIQNSWGVEWCDAGRIWVSEMFVRDADELTCMDVRLL